MKRILLVLFVFVSFSFVYAGNYSQEERRAYTWAYNNWITTMQTIDKADMNWEITRIALAKMISNYAMKTFNKKWDAAKKCVFTDVTSDLDKKYDNWVTNSCRLGLMWQWITKFRPYDKVTRAEVWTILSRFIYWSRYDWWIPYYRYHLNQLKYLKIINKIADADKINETRGNVMIYLKKSKETLVKPVIEWWDWRFEIRSDSTIFYDSWHWISLKLWKEFKWWLIVDEIAYYPIREITFYVKDDTVKNTVFWTDWYKEKFIIAIAPLDQGSYNTLEMYWKNSKYNILVWNYDHNDTKLYYSDLNIFEANLEVLWNQSCTDNLKGWLSSMEPNWVFYDIVWKNDWKDGWKVPEMNFWELHIDSFQMVDRAWILYYTNNDTKRKLDFQCHATVGSENNVSASFWNISFVE